MLLTYGIGGLACFLSFMFVIFSRLRQKYLMSKNVLDYMNFAVMIAASVWGLTSYMPLIAVKDILGISIFYVYAVAKALK